MAVTLSSLVAAHPEFSDVSTDHPTIVTNAIAEAQRRIDSSVLGDRYDDAVMWLACDIIENSPFGQDMRMTPEGKPSYYYQEFMRLCRPAGTSYRMII